MPRVTWSRNLKQVVPQRICNLIPLFQSKVSQVWEPAGKSNNWAQSSPCTAPVFIGGVQQRHKTTACKIGEITASNTFVPLMAKEFCHRDGSFYSCSHRMYYNNDKRTVQGGGNSSFLLPPSLPPPNSMGTELGQGGLLLLFMCCSRKFWAWPSWRDSRGIVSGSIKPLYAFHKSGEEGIDIPNIHYKAQC